MSISANGARTDFSTAANVQLNVNNPAADTSNVTATPDQSQPAAAPVKQPNESEQTKHTADPDTITKKLGQVNKALEEMNPSVQYRLVQDKGTDVVQLYDKDNKKVIYQIPAQGILDVADKLAQSSGHVIDLKK